MVKRILAGVCSLCLIMTSAVIAAAEPQEHLNVYVKNGAQNGNGSFEAPFTSIEEARDYIRDLKKNGQFPKYGITVSLRGGIYNISEGIEFTQEDSGTEEGLITYRNYADEDVTLDGGIEIDISQFKNVTDENILNKIPSNAKKGVKEYNLYQNGITREMIGELYYTATYPELYEQFFGLKSGENSTAYFNDEKITIARWPNEEFATIEKVADPGSSSTRWTESAKASGYYEDPATANKRGMKIGIPKEKAKLWKEAKEGWAFGQWNVSWSSSSTPIKSIDAENAVLETVGDAMSRGGAKIGQGYYVFNMLEELDVPGEYYIDRDTGMLYFYPPSSNGVFEMTALKECMFTLDKTENMRIKGLTVKNTVAGVIDARQVKNFGVEHCVINNVSASTGVKISGESYNSYISGCHLYNFERAVIDINGGECKEMIDGGMYVKNCWIHDFAQSGLTYAPGVYIRGVGTTVSNCRINNCPHSAILLDSMYPNIKIENNEIYNACMTATDAGAIYTGKSWIGRGLDINNNYIHDIGNGLHGAYGVYMDDFMCGVTVRSNIFENISGNQSAAFAGGGRDTVCTDNVFINCYASWRGVAAKTGMTTRESNGVNDWKASNLGYGLHMGINMEKYAEAFPNFLDFEPDNDNAEITPEAQVYNVNWKYSVFKDNYAVNIKEDPVWANKAGWSNDEDALKSIEWKPEDYIKCVTGVDPGFESISKKDYRMKKDAEIYRLIPDFEACDFENVGVYTQRLKDKLGDTISMKVDSPIVYNGFKETIIDKNNYEITPVIINNRTMLPIRFLAEVLGGSAQWDESERKATITVGSDVIVFDINNAAIEKNGMMIETDTSPMIYQGRTVVPLRAVAESLNKEIDWYDGGFDNKLIFISDIKVFDHDKDLEYILEISKRLGVK